MAILAMIRFVQHIHQIAADAVTLDEIMVFWLMMCFATYRHKSRSVYCHFAAAGLLAFAVGASDHTSFAMLGTVCSGIAGLAV